MTHANAPLTPFGRLRLAKLIVEDAWAVRRAAERFQCSPATASKWAARYRAGRVLARYRMPLLAHVDQATGLPIRKTKPTRYQAAVPGELVHVDIKKLGRIPDGGGWRVHGRGSEQDKRAHVSRNQPARRGAKGSRGYVYLHHAVDGCSRLAHSEQLPDERKETAAAFWTRAKAFFADAGITVTAGMTDNGPCYRSKDFAAALGKDVKHRRTRPYRPQTNGKVCESEISAALASV